jgi:hypothetical protein
MAILVSMAAITAVTIRIAAAMELTDIAAVAMRIRVATLAACVEAMPEGHVDSRVVALAGSAVAAAAADADKV